MEEDDNIKSCCLVKVIRVVKKEGDGTKENPIHESVTYFTTDGVLIGRFDSCVEKSVSASNRSANLEHQILNSLLEGMKEYANGSQGKQQVVQK